MDEAIDKSIKLIKAIVEIANQSTREIRLLLDDGHEGTASAVGLVALGLILDEIKEGDNDGRN